MKMYCAAPPENNSTSLVILLRREGDELTDDIETAAAELAITRVSDVAGD